MNIFMGELVILDLDNVIVKGQSQILLLNYLLEKKIISSFYYFKILAWFILYKIGITKNPRRIMEYAFSFLEGKDVSEIEAVIGKFFETHLKKFIFREMADIINKHKKEERRLVIISNAIDVIVEKIAEFLGVHNHIGTELAIVEGKFTGKIEGDIVYGDNKKTHLVKFIEENNLSLTHSWAYADHISDVVILELVGNPFVINPGRKMRKEAQKRKWPIIFFQK